MENENSKVDNREFGQFVGWIGLPPEAAERVLSYPAGEQAYGSFRELFFRDREALFKKVGERGDEKRMYLYLYCRLAYEAREIYEERGISDDVCRDTFGDIALWCACCFRDHGEYGIAEYGWLWRHVTLTLFRLGRLQFELYRSPEDIEAGGISAKKGQVLLNVHIPEGEPLLPEICDHSFDKAERFFGGGMPYVCHSWMLYPGLSKVLGASSNILRFQRRFTVYRTDDASREAEERVFTVKRENAADYQEDTSLQRAVKKGLMEGSRFGSGYGIMRYR